MSIIVIINILLSLHFVFFTLILLSREAEGSLLSKNLTTLSTIITENIKLTKPKKKPPMLTALEETLYYYEILMMKNDSSLVFIHIPVERRSACYL
jgi:hypothetical protein